MLASLTNLLPLLRVANNMHKLLLTATAILTLMLPNKSIAVDNELTNTVTANKEIIVHSANYDNQFVLESIQNILKLSSINDNQFLLKRSPNIQHGEAFEALIKGEIDIFVTSSTLQREALAPRVFLPLDRGLLGFRLCLVHNKLQPFNKINSPGDFIHKALSVGLGEDWPDRKVFENSGFKTVTNPSYYALFTMLNEQKIDCLSRSVMEVDHELEKFKHLDIKLEEQLVFIYPNADFIFVNPSKPELLTLLEAGANASVTNNSYYEIFHKYNEAKLLQHQVYERKLIFLDNQELSDEARASINKFGVASFIRHRDDKPLTLENTIR